MAVAYKLARLLDIREQADVLHLRLTRGLLRRLGVIPHPM